MTARLLAGAVVALALLDAAVLAASSVGLGIGAWTARAAIVLAVAGGVAAARLVRPEPPKHTLEPRWMSPVCIAAVAVAATAWLLLFVAAWAKPDDSFDGNAYHVGAIHEWMRAGGVRWIELPRSAGARWQHYADLHFNAYPKGVELVAYVLVVALGTDAVANAVNLVFVVVGAIAIADLARSLGAGKRASIAAACAYVLVPVNVCQATTLYVDAGSGACIVALVAAARRVTERVDFGNALVFGCASALVLAAKPTGLVPFGVAWLVVIVVALRRRRARAAPLAVALAVALAVGACWHARNIVHMGNPVYPAEVRVFGRVLAKGIPYEAIIGGQHPNPDWSWARRVLVAWTEDLPHWPASVGHVDDRKAGLGLLWLFGCVPSIVVARRARGVGVVACIVAGAFALTPASWWARFTVWLYALGLPCAALALSRPTRVRAALALAIGALHVFEGGWAVAWTAFTPSSYADPVASPVRYDDEPLYPVARGPLAREAFASADPIAVGGSEVELTPLLGMAMHPLGVREVVYLDEDPAHDSSAELGHVAFVLLERGVPAPPSITARARAREVEGVFYKVYDLRGAPVDTPAPAAEAVAYGDGFGLQEGEGTTSIRWMGERATFTSPDVSGELSVRGWTADPGSRVELDVGTRRVLSDPGRILLFVTVSGHVTGSLRCIPARSPCAAIRPIRVEGPPGRAP